MERPRAMAPYPSRGRAETLPDQEGIRMAVAPPTTTREPATIDNIKTYWDRALLDAGKPDLVYADFGNKDGVPRGYDAANPGTLDAIEWLRKERIPVNTVFSGANAAQRPEALYSAAPKADHDANLGGYQLTEGNDPTSSDGQPIARKIALTPVRATPQEYGAYYIGTARQKRAGLHAFRELVTDILGQNMAEVVDTVTRNQLTGNVMIQYAGAATSDDTVAAGMLIGFKEIVIAVATLKEKFAKWARNGHFVAIIGPRTWGTMMLDELFQQTVIFGNKNTMFEGKIDRGQLPWVGVEFYETQYALHRTAALTEVHSTFIFAKDCYGVIDLEGLGTENIFHDVGSAGTQDPMNQRWTQAWHTTWVAKVLNSNWGIELRHAVAI
jgi:N4-gp56 family major capsid protein